jgi:hypothetical protein
MDVGQYSVLIYSIEEPVAHAVGTYALPTKTGL